MHKKSLQLEFEKRYYWLLLPELILVIYVAAKKLIYRMLRRTPAYNTWWYDRLDTCQEIRKTAEKGLTALSLTVVYNYNPHSPPKNFDQLIERWWMRMPAAQAVRNRKTIVIDLLESEVRTVWAANGQKPVNIVFLAGGFVETGIAVAERVARDGILVNCTVMDISKKTLNMARIRTERAGVQKMFTFMRVNLLDFEKIRKHLSVANVHIIEMIGILDYLSKKQATELFSITKDSLLNNGLLLTGNVLPTFWEAPFLYVVVNWPRMKHRTSRSFSEMLNEAGFTSDSHKKHIEPHKIFMMYEVRNTKKPLIETSAEIFPAAELSVSISK